MKSFRWILLIFLGMPLLTRVLIVGMHAAVHPAAQASREEDQKLLDSLPDEQGPADPEAYYVGPERQVANTLKGLISKYDRCMGSAAAKYAPTGASPSDVAEAAHGACIEQFNVLSSSTFEAFRAAGAGESAPLLASRILDETKSKDRALVIKVLLSERIKRDSPAPASPYQEL